MRVLVQKDYESEAVWNKDWNSNHTDTQTDTGLCDSSIHFLMQAVSKSEYNQIKYSWI